MAPSPVVARWELSRRLAARRRELGLEVKAITDQLGFTRNYWSAVENDRTLIAEDKLRMLFDVLDFPESDQAELLQLREDSRKRGWWDEYPSLSDEHKRFYGMEAGADRIRAYDGHIMPGILQIEEYARALIAADPGFSPVDIDLLATVRRRRRHRLLRPGPPDLSVLISEAVLHQQVAGPKVQADQLRYIDDVVSTGEAKLVVRILPFDRHPGAIINSTTLTFLEYQSSHLGSTAWQEGVRLLGDVDAAEDHFRRLDLAWAEALKRSLDPTRSMEMLRQAIAEFEHSGSSSADPPGPHPT